MVKRKNRTKYRVCLKCNRKFISYGIQNRICPQCREQNAGLYYNVFSIPPRN